MYHFLTGVFSMKEETKKQLATTIRDIYLYPNRSKAENIVRGLIWCISFAVGVFVPRLITPETIDQRSLHGAYLVYALSVLLEFALEYNESTFGMIIHGIFIIISFVLFITSTIYIIVPIPVKGSPGYLFYRLTVYYAGLVLATIIAIRLVLAATNMHRLFYKFDTDETQKDDAKKLAEAVAIIEKHKETLALKQ